jgi:hypothetical protein
MSISSVGAGGWQPQTASLSNRKPDTTPGVGEGEEGPKLRLYTPEDEEKQKKLLAGEATNTFRNILKEDAARDAERRAANGQSPTGVVVDISA